MNRTAVLAIVLLAAACTTSNEAATTSTESPTTTTATTTVTTTTATTTPTTVTTTTTTTPPVGPVHLVVDTDTTITNTLTLRPGDTIEFRNGAGLIFGPGGSADWQGTPVATWSDDGATQNLDRDVRVFGNGHFQFGPGSFSSTINYVEIDLQPDLVFDEYPLHWHHAGDGSRGTEVVGTVVKNSTNRAFVPHASHGITFRDTIASNVVLSGYWWNPVPFPKTTPKSDVSDQSHDILYDHILVDGVVSQPGNPNNGRGLQGISLPHGTGNVIRDSVAMNVQGADNNGGCFVWPSGASKVLNVWTAENLVAHDCQQGIFVWQNDPETHIIDGFRGYNNRADIEHGAYGNRYVYRNVDVDTISSHARGWVLGCPDPDDSPGPCPMSRATTINVFRNRAVGLLIFRRVDVDQVNFKNALNSGTNAMTIHAIDTGLRPSGVDCGTAVPGSRVEFYSNEADYNDGAIQYPTKTC